MGWRSKQVLLQGNQRREQVSWLWFGIVTGAIIAVTWTLREHRKMLRTMAQVIQIHEHNFKLLIKRENEKNPWTSRPLTEEDKEHYGQEGENK